MEVEGEVDVTDTVDAVGEDAVLAVMVAALVEKVGRSAESIYCDQRGRRFGETGREKWIKPIRI